MTDTFVTLDKVEDGYTVFEKDQVLTPEQLNRLAGYLDEQGRLTRVGLVGVGIACGLWPSLEGAKVQLTHGVATTTDGDLMLVAEDAVYNRYKPYDTGALKYGPLERGALPVFELVAEGKDDDRAMPLSDFGARLASMVAVLYVESHLHDPDVCTGTDCDNRGLNAVFALRLLLVDPRHAPLLLEKEKTPDAAARGPLEPITVQRPDLPAVALTSEAALAGVYLAACKSIHGEVVSALSAIHKACEFFLGELAPRDPGPQWKKALGEIGDKVQNRGIQYYYDFLKDLAETYNAFRDVLFGDTTVCCPRFDAFPKHVVLGVLAAKLRAAGGRTGWYPSPATSIAEEQRLHALFLLRKIDALIVNFALPGPGEIRITPSAFEDRPLEGRAIPFYYQPAVHQAWSYALATKGMERFAYSYHAPSYDALGGAAKPHLAQIGAFDFFRVEGHLGWDVRKAAEALRQEIRRQNLPIDVETVLVGGNRVKVVFEPPWRHFDLYRLRHLARADVALQLDQAGKYGKKLAEHVGKAVEGKVISNADVGEGVEAKGLAANKGNELEGQTQKLTLMLDQDTSQEAFQQEAIKAMGMAADFTLAFSPVMKKEYVSPLDNLIDARPLHWLTWLDRIIKDADEKEADRLLLSAYLAQHPGLEHFAGALRGGTFVLAHDEAGTVVADFMLPYNCCERRGQVLEPPKLDPLPKPPLVFDGPIRVIPFPDKFRFFQFQEDFKKNVLEKELDQYKSYFNTYKEVVLTAMGTKAGGGMAQPGGTLVQPGGEIVHIGDRMLAMHVADTQWKERRVDLIRTTLLAPELEAAKRTGLELELKNAEAELGNAILTTTQYVAGANLEVKAGTEGAAVMQLASTSLGKVNDIDTLARVEKGLTTLGTKPGMSPDLSKTIGNVLASRGLM